MTTINRLESALHEVDGIKKPSTTNKNAFRKFNRTKVSQ